MQAAFEAVIGIESHVRLNTKTKAFCGCANEYGAKPNTHVCPICLAHPVSPGPGNLHPSIPCDCQSCRVAACIDTQSLLGDELGVNSASARSLSGSYKRTWKLSSGQQPCNEGGYKEQVSFIVKESHAFWSFMNGCRYISQPHTTKYWLPDLQ